MKEFIFTWSIENISFSWHKTREIIVSPKFFASPIQNSAWKLRLYPRGFENSDYLSLFLRREKDSASENLAVNFELSCISADTSSLQSCFIPETFRTFTKVEERGFGVLRFIRRYVFGRRKALYLPQDTLTLRCRMWQLEDKNEFQQLFGRTQLTIERIISVEKIKPEIQMYIIHEILTKCNKVPISISLSLYENVLDVQIFRISEMPMRSTTLNLSFVDKGTERKLWEHKIVWFDGPRSEEFRLPFSSTLLYTEKDNSLGSNFAFLSEICYSTGTETKSIETDYKPIIPEFLSNFIISYVPSGKLTDYPSISEEIWNLYKEQILCDVELKTKDRSLFAHKVVLSARSSVFLAMLTGEMKERISKCIEIGDISADTLEKFLVFLYTDDFEDLKWDAVAELYYAADKYQVERLKLLCSCHLMKNVDVDNVCAFLMLADKHNDFELRQKVDYFIWKNDEKVFKSSAWKKFAIEQSHLAVKSMLSKYEEKEIHCPEILYKISNHPKFLDDLRSLYERQIVSDIVIKTASTSFPAHKTVLCVSSSVLKDMLSSDMGYKSTDFIEIVDLEDDTVSTMLFFLYTDSFEDMQWDTAKKLYHASDVYQIRRLKFKCSCYLMENLRESNACDLLLLAHEHSDDRLKSAVEDYICVYDEEIFTSDEWAKLSETNLLLANETMRARYKKIK